jgi:hypothetical protein
MLLVALIWQTTMAKLMVSLQPCAIDVAIVIGYASSGTLPEFGEATPDSFPRAIKSSATMGEC